MNYELIRDSEIYLDALGFSVAVITRDGTIVHTNLKWRQFMEHNGGCAETCDVHSNYLEVSRVDELSYNNISGVLSGTLPAASWDYTCHAPSEKRWFMAIASPLIDKHANLIGATISHVDVSTRKTSELLLHNLAYIDQLTQIPNRRYLLDFGKTTLERADHNGHTVACIFVDCDNFKRINDSNGHLVGDAVLEIIAKKVKNIIRDEDVVCRFGGDEFCIIMPYVENVEDAEGLANRLLFHLREPIQINGKVVDITCSLGLAVRKPHGMSLYELIHMADEGMYKAKLSGKNQWSFSFK